MIAHPPGPPSREGGVGAIAPPFPTFFNIFSGGRKALPYVGADTHFIGVPAMRRAVTKCVWSAPDLL